MVVSAFKVCLIFSVWQDAFLHMFPACEVAPRWDNFNSSTPLMPFKMSTENLLLFADDAAQAARVEAIDQLHMATAIYTADPVVADLLQRLRWPAPGRKLADVSAGDGQFMCQALRKLLSVGVQSDDELLDSLEGYEIHAFACSQARARLVDILVGAGRDRDSAVCLAERMVHNKDFLTQGPVEPTYAAVIGNPPYIRRLKVPALLRDEYDQCVPSYAAGDLLHGFIDRVSKVLVPGGEMAFVSSDRWLAASGAAALREKIGARFNIRHVERLDAQSVFYRPKDRKAGTPPRISPIAIHIDEHPGGSPITRAAIFPGADTALFAGLPTLGEVARVEMAPWLGPAGIFVVTPDQVASSRLPASCLVPAFDADDIVDGKLQEPKRFAIRTRPDEIPCQEVLDHLAANMDRMPLRGRRGSAHLPPESFWRMDLDVPSLVVARIAKTPAAIRVPAGVLPMDHHLRITCYDPARLAAIERWLASDLAALWLSQHASPLENGYFLIGAERLRQMPVDVSV